MELHVVAEPGPALVGYHRGCDSSVEHKGVAVTVVLNIKLRARCTNACVCTTATTPIQSVVHPFVCSRKQGPTAVTTVVTTS